jgi:hypothetical protein
MEESTMKPQEKKPKKCQCGGNYYLDKTMGEYVCESCEHRVGWWHRWEPETFPLIFSI